MSPSTRSARPKPRKSGGEDSDSDEPRFPGLTPLQRNRVLSRHRKAPVANPSRILVRLPNWVGDACLAFPLLKALRDAYPEAHLAALGRPNVIGLAGLAPVDEVLLLEDAGPVWVRPWRLRRAANKIRLQGFQVGMTLATTASAALLFRMAGIAQTVGYGRGAAQYLLSHPLPWKPSRDLHRASAYLGLIAGLGLDVPKVEWAPPSLPAESLAAGKARLGALAERKFRVGLGVGSVGESRRWPVESYAALGDALANELSAGIVLLGAPSDRPLAEQVARLMRTEALNLTGETKLEEMPAVLAALDLFVANDSGGAHLAAVAQVPTMVFFGAGDPKITAPLSPSCEVLTHPVECAPCRKNTCRFNMECMTGITVERVVARARARLQGKAVPHAP